ncbi:MAG TPA: hypothetical protein VH496_09255 [Mycobacterium sp.]|jgi:hypothetical protein
MPAVIDEHLRPHRAGRCERQVAVPDRPPNGLSWRALPDGQDPAVYLARHGSTSAFRARPDGSAVPLVSAATADIIAGCHRRGNPDWPETKMQIAHSINRYLRSYPKSERAAAAGIACTVAVTRADIHPDTLLNLAPVLMSADRAPLSVLAADREHAVTDHVRSR